MLTSVRERRGSDSKFRGFKSTGNLVLTLNGTHGASFKNYFLKVLTDFQIM